MTAQLALTLGMLSCEASDPLTLGIRSFLTWAALHCEAYGTMIRNISSVLGIVSDVCAYDCLTV